MSEIYRIGKGTTIAAAISGLNLGRKPVAGRIGDRLVDLNVPLEAEAEAALVFPGSPEALEILRHSAAHLLAHAVLELYPEAKTGVGPAVENGYYYDFLRECPFTPEDLEAIEKRMKEIVEADVPVRRLVLDKEEAVRRFEARGQELKVELIREKGDAKVTVYEQGGFADFCLGPHVPSTGVLRHVKLLSVSGAYWKGDEKGRQLQRIYGTVFFMKKELDEYLTMLEEAKKRDHRRIGQELDPFPPPRSSAAASSSGTPRAPGSGPSSSSTGASGTGRAATRSSIRRTSAAKASGRPRATSASTRTACTRRCRSTSRIIT